MKPQFSRRLHIRFLKRNPIYFDQRLLLILTAAASLLLAVGVESLQRGSVTEAWVWISDHQSLFAFNALLALCVLLTFLALLGSLIPAAALSLLLLSAVALISYYKMKLIGEPFYPWDLILNKEGTNIAPLVTERSALLRIGAIGALFLALLLLWPILRRLHLKLALLSRIIVGGIALTVLISFGAKATWAERWMDQTGVEEIVWNQQENYTNNGILLAFTLNIKNSIIPRPSDYGEKTVETIAGQITEERAISTASAPAESVKPNVIFIMNEAFWDPTLLPGLTFTEDPAPTLHRLQQESTSGYLISPVFGGGTSNSEFEVLTGLSMSFLPSGSVPYQQYISKPLPSLASYFKELGYKSMAIHPYEDWFWNRDKVYPWMGFDSFKSQAQFADPVYKGEFISDEEVSRSIVHAAEGSDKPLFIYTVTMQNHGPYEGNRYGSNSIGITGNLTEAARQSLETYTQGIHDADQSLQLLIDQFTELGEPTLIVFYGDHLPMLGYDYDAYMQTGFLHSPHSQDWTPEELRKIHSVPFAAWSNFGMPKEHIPALSYSFLGAHFLSSLNLELPGQFAMNRDVYQQLPAMIHNLAINSNGSSTSTIPEENQAIVEEYRILQYDLLFGKSYLAQFIDTPFLTGDVSDRFNEEFDKPDSNPN